MWQVCEVSAEGQVRFELETRFQQLQSRLASVTLETEEVKSVPHSLFLRTPSEMLIAVLCVSLTLIYVEFLQISKTLKTTLSNLLESICDDDCNPTPDASTTPSVESTGDGTGTKPTLAKRRANQQDTETFYFTVRSPPLVPDWCTLWPKISGHPLLFIKDALYWSKVTVKTGKISISHKVFFWTFYSSNLSWFPQKY